MASKARFIADLISGRGATKSVKMDTQSPTFVDLTLSTTTSFTVPKGTTAQRDGTAASGMLRFNTTLGKFEGYTTEWAELGGGSSDTWTTDNFTADGSAQAYTLTITPSSESNVIVFIEGVFQNPGDFALSGNTLTLEDVPSSGSRIVVHSVKACLLYTSDAADE